MSRLHLAGELRIEGARRIALCPGGDTIAVATAGDRIFLRSLSTGAAVPAIEAPPGVDALWADASGLLSAIAADTGTRTWLVAKGRAEAARAPALAEEPREPDASMIDLLEAEEDALHAVVSPDGTRIAVATAGGEVVLRDADGGREGRMAVLGHQTEVADVCFAPDGDRVASCGTDGLVRAWAAGPVNGAPPFAEPESILGNIPADYQVFVDRIRGLGTASLPGLASEVATRSSRGVVVLRAFLQDPWPRVRYRTLWLLGTDGIWGFPHELTDALHDPNESVRRAALGAIDALDETACTEDVRDLLDRERDPAARELAEGVLNRFTG